MSSRIQEPEKAMAALFEGLTRLQRMALLGRLEAAGGAVYRALAADEQNVKAREALIKAAEDEERNGDLRRLMSTPKGECERCKKALPLHGEGCACSFQCTFCADCARALDLVCPNCGGSLEPRERLRARP